jgi:hypothetical protein
MNRVNVMLSNMFANPSGVNSHLNQPAVMANALLQNQTATAAPILEGGKCVGVKAYYIDSSSIGDVSTPTDCTTPGGNQVGTLSVNYDSAVIADAAGNALDSRCDNEVDFIQESASVITALMANLRKQFNAVVINATDAASMVNISTALPDTWNANNAIIEVPKNEMTWDNLGYLKLTADLNNLSNPIWISGAGNFWGEWWKSNYQRLNNNEAGIFAAFADQNFYFDSRQLDQTIGSAATFAVDQNSYIFWNTVKHTAVPTEYSVGSNGKKWVWTIADPLLTYRVGNSIVPVQYEIEVEESCDSRDTLSFLVKKYKYYARIIGGFKFAPVGAVNSETGVLQFNSVAGI